MSVVVSKLPDEVKAMLQGIDFEQVLDNVLDSSDIKLAGTETVAGQLTPSGPAPDALPDTREREIRVPLAEVLDES